MPVTLTAFRPIKSMRGQGRAEPDLLISRLNERIGEDLTAAGSMGDGVSTEGHVSCS